MRIVTVALVTSLLLTACGEEEAAPPPEETAEMAAITGVIMYRERIGLTPDARVELRLLDVSRQDVAAEEIAMVAIDNPGQPPIAFSIEYNPADINESMTYSVSAKVFDREQLIFISDTINPVLTRGAGNDILVEVVRVSQNRQAKPDASLEDTRWTLASVGGQQVLATEDAPAPFLQLHSDQSTISGFSGCNRFTGSYTLTGNQFKVGNLASTSMACPDSDDIEPRFIGALSSFSRLEIKGLIMEAYAEDAMLATFTTEEAPSEADLFK